MKEYRFSLEASLCVSVTGDSQREAIEKVRKIVEEYFEEGMTVRCYNSNVEDARVYVDPIVQDTLCADDIVDEMEIEE